MHVNNSKPSSYQENEIDFRDLMVSLFASKRLILAITLAITVLVSIYTFTITPIYQATATVILGNYETPKVTCSDVLYHQSSCTTTPSRKKFVYSASASCYGLNSSRTNEKGKIDTKYPYALSKYMGEQTAFHWHKVYGLPVNSIRIFNAYGTRVRTTGAYGAVFGVFFKQRIKKQPLTIIGNGKQSRDFVYVTDVAKAFYSAAKSKKSGEIYNLGSDKPQSVNTFANLIGGKKTFIPDRPGEPKRTWANITKIKRDLNWRPTIKFKKGVEKMFLEIKNWKDAPLWNPSSIKEATSDWFKYLKEEK